MSGCLRISFLLGVSGLQSFSRMSKRAIVFKVWPSSVPDGVLKARTEIVSILPGI